jgi:hypothetical protein
VEPKEIEGGHWRVEGGGEKKAEIENRNEPLTAYHGLLTKIEVNHGEEKS